MSQSVGELFVNLGIKGAEKTVGALTSVKDGMSGLASTSLETKAAIIGAMYALERLFAASSAQGTSLTNLKATFGITAKTLQEYQYAARQVGISNEDVTASFKTLQSVMAKAALGAGLPQYAGVVSQVLGDKSFLNFKTYQDHPELLIQKLQQYAQKEKNIGTRNEVLKSFVGEAMATAMVRNAFRPEVFKQAPTYNDKEIASLDRANIAWSNLGTKIEMAIGHFNSIHGGQLVGDISKIIDSVIKLATVLTILAEKIKLFEILGKTIGSAAKGVSGLTTLLTGSDKEKKILADKTSKILGGKSPRHMMGAGEYFNSRIEGLKNLYHSFVPSTPAGASSGGNNTQNIDINQTLQFQHAGTDHKKTADSVKQAAKEYTRQSAAALQVN